MFLKIISVVSALLIVAGSAVRAPGAEVYLEIGAKGSERIEVAVPRFFALGEKAGGEAYFHLTSTMSRVVRDDLAFSGLFKVIEKDGFVQEQEREDRTSGQINFKEWAALGAVALVKGGFYMEDGRLVLEGELFDVDKGKRIIGVKYSGDPRIYRTLAHRLSDEIVYRLTGEKGIFRSKIAFLSRYRKNKELFVMDYDGNNVFRLSQDRTAVVTPAWSPDGKRIAFSSYVDRNPDLYVMDADGTNRQAISLAQGLNVGASWSPDGNKIALTMSKDGNVEIYLIDLKTGKQKRLTRNRVTDSSPAWSPDGKKIAFTSDRSGSPQIHIMDADGKNARRVTYWGSYNDQAAWSPRGGRIAFTGRQQGRFDIYTMNADGSDLRRLTADAGNNESPTWSPDGRHIAFSSDRSGAPQIYIMRSDGSGQRAVTRLAGGGYAPVWSPRPGDWPSLGKE
jgi:TolB protein